MVICQAGQGARHVEAMESPLVVWATFFLILEVIQFFFLHKASTKSLSNRPRGASGFFQGIKGKLSGYMCDIAMQAWEACSDNILHFS